MGSAAWKAFLYHGLSPQLPKECTHTVVVAMLDTVKDRCKGLRLTEFGLGLRRWTAESTKEPPACQETAKQGIEMMQAREVERSNGDQARGLELFCADLAESLHISEHTLVEKR